MEETSFSSFFSLTALLVFPRNECTGGALTVVPSLVEEEEGDTTTTDAVAAPPTMDNTDMADITDPTRVVRLLFIFF